MPLIFATGAPTASGHAYEDIYGVQYEFPDRYKGLVVEGERFLYYRGKRGAPTGTGPVYLGDGIVGKVRESTNPGLWVAQVRDVTTFAKPLPFTDPNGNYLETGSTTPSNWTSGVRRTSDEVFSHIVQVGMESSGDGPTGPTGFFADPKHAKEMERYSVDVAMKLLAAEFGADNVKEMPPGNPGYDIEVATTNGTLHVEVKGTVMPDPVFHLSEGQRKHGILQGELFRLVVVHGINVGEKSHLVRICRGDELAEQANLEPASWIGVLLP